MNFSKSLQLLVGASVAAAAAAQRPDRATSLRWGKSSCNGFKEETCYDEEGNEFCAPRGDGGCPCPEGEEKCGAIEWLGFTGTCTKVCCDIGAEEICLNENGDPESCAAFADGGCPCPEGEEKCGAIDWLGYLGYCTKACCDIVTEEICLDGEGVIESCAAFSEGGCPCPEGQQKCDWPGALANITNHPGYCANACCDFSTEQACHDEDWNLESCAAYEDGGCPCPEGEEKCTFGATDILGQGVCLDPAVCCDLVNGEKPCLGDNFTWTCSEECDSDSYDMQEGRIAMYIQAKGTPKETNEFRGLRMKLKKVLPGKLPADTAKKLKLEQKVVELFHDVKLREKNVSIM